MATVKSDSAIAAPATPTPAKAKAPKTKKTITAGPKKSSKTSVPSHPPYGEMIKEAVSSLKERNGSSLYAIAKYVGQKQPSLPSNYKKLLSIQLKRQVAGGKLVKVKNSFKLSAVNKSKSSEIKKVSSKTGKVKVKAAGKAVAAKVGDKRKAITTNKATKAAKTSVKSTPGGKKAAGAAKLKKSSAVKKPKSMKSAKAKSIKKAVAKGNKN